jgi:hypothetical protein
VTVKYAGVSLSDECGDYALYHSWQSQNDLIDRHSDGSGLGWGLFESKLEELLFNGTFCHYITRFLYKAVVQSNFDP